MIGMVGGIFPNSTTFASFGATGVAYATTDDVMAAPAGAARNKPRANGARKTEDRITRSSLVERRRYSKFLKIRINVTNPG